MRTEKYRVAAILYFGPGKFNIARNDDKRMTN